MRYGVNLKNDFLHSVTQLMCNASFQKSTLLPSLTAACISRHACTVNNVELGMHRRLRVYILQHKHIGSKHYIFMDVPVETVELTKYYNYSLTAGITTTREIPFLLN